MREDWKYQPLGEICDFISGFTPSKQELNEKAGIPYFKVSDMNRDTNSVYMIETELFVVHPRKTIPANSIIFPKNGGAIFTGKKRILKYDSIIDLNTEALNIKDKNVNLQFLYTFLLGVDFGQFDNGGGLPSINIKKMKDFIVPVPPLSDQERIVALLDDQFAKIDALKANADQQLKAAKDLFQSALKEMLTPKEGWDEKTLGDIGEFTRGGNFTKSDFVSEGIPCIHYGQVHMHFGVTTEKTLSYLPKDFPKVKYAKQGDLIIAITSEDDEGSCKCTAWLGNEDVAVGGHIAVYHHSLNPKFMSYYFRSPKFQTEKLAFTHGFKVVEIKPSDIAKIPILYPKDKDEQQKIVSRLDAISEKVKTLQANYDQTITLCNDLKQSLLKSIFA